MSCDTTVPNAASRSGPDLESSLCALGPGFGIRDSGFGIRDSGFGIRDSGASVAADRLRCKACLCLARS